MVQVELEWKTKKFFTSLIFEKSFFLNNYENHALILIIFLVWIGRGITFEMVPKVKMAYEVDIPYLFLTVKTTGGYTLYIALLIGMLRKTAKEDFP